MVERSAFGGYGDVARDFNENRPYHSPWAIDWLKEHLYVASGRPPRILDVGCGTGNFTRQIAKANYRNVRGNRHRARFNIIGIDPDPRMIEIAKKNGGPHYEIASASKIPFHDESFDAVVAHNSFLMFWNDEAAIAEIKRVMRRPGSGLLPPAVFMVVGWGLSELGWKRYRTIARFVNRPESKLKGYAAGEISYAPLLREYGFQNVETRSRTVVIEYNIDEAYCYMRRGSLLSRVPTEKLEDAYSALRELCEQEADTSGKLYRAINVIVDVAGK